MGMLLAHGFTTEPALFNWHNEHALMPQNSIFCIALSRGRAGRIVLDLKEASFSNTEISALFLDQGANTSPAVADEAALAVGEPPIQSPDVLRGVMTWIAAVACHVVSGGDPIIAAGPIATALSDAPVAGVADGLMVFGVSPVQARRYEDRIKDGHILVLVHAESSEKSDQAREIFTAAGAEDICLMPEGFSPHKAPDRACRLPSATFA